MSETIISEKTAIALSKFLGKSAPAPLHRGSGADEQYFPMYSEGVYRYFLHDLLSKPFCDGIAKQIFLRKEKCFTWRAISHDIYEAWIFGGMEAVEKALTEMMEGK